jgi:hypothetical protein
MKNTLSLISTKATAQGLTNIQEQCNSLLTNVNNLQAYMGGGINSLFNQDVQSIISLIDGTNFNFNESGALITNVQIYDQLNPLLDKIDGLQNE